MGMVFYPETKQIEITGGNSESREIVLRLSKEGMMVG